jgi:hypothetical protein
LIDNPNYEMLKTHRYAKETRTQIVLRKRLEFSFLA